jgi:hypothetical protein
MTDETRKKWAELNAILNPQPAQAAQPDAPGFNEAMSDKTRETARTFYGAAIMKKDAAQLTTEERNFLRQSIRAWEQGGGDK